MKILVLSLSALFAFNALAALAYDSQVHQKLSGKYHCIVPNDESRGMKTIEFIGDQFKAEDPSKKISDSGTIIDETESLNLMQKEVGFKKYVFTGKDQMKFMTFTTSSGTLLMSLIYGDSSAKSEWNLPAFDPDIVCTPAL